MSVEDLHFAIRALLIAGPELERIWGLMEGSTVSAARSCLFNRWTWRILNLISSIYADSEFREGMMRLGSRGFFPHVLLKNVVVELQFSVEDGLVAEEGFKPWACALEDGNAVMGPVFSDPRACEVVMMVGLPASGKTTWAEKWVKQHPEKRYILLGTNLILDQMKVCAIV